VLLAGRVAWRLAPERRRWVAAAVAGGAVALCQGWWWHAAVGNAEGLFLALVLAAADQALDGRHRRALGLGVAAGLLRPEAWPFLALYGAWLWRRDPRLRPALGVAAVALPVSWLAPELWGSGDLLRSSDRARIPNPGQPATADRPALAALWAAAAIPLAQAIPLAALARRWWLAGAAVAWLALVALMAERGYSGEPRYALPGAALLGVAAGVGAARLPRGWLAVAAVAALPFAVLRVGDVRGELGRAAHEARLWSSLDDAVRAAGGRDAVLRCGRPAVGRLRGTGAAYALRVHKREVDADGRAGARLVLRSSLRRGDPVTPAPSGRLIGRSARWEIWC
jgi:hypothetical protein